MHLNCHKFTIIYSNNTLYSYVSTSLFHHQEAQQSVHTTIMFGLTVQVEELLVIIDVVNCYTVNKSSVWMI
jgi:hypothetical protein